MSNKFDDGFKKYLKTIASMEPGDPRLKKLMSLRGKGAKFIVDSKGRVKKMYKKGGEVTQFKGHF